MTTAAKVRNLLKREGFHVINNSEFVKEVCGSWVTHSKHEEAVYVRPHVGTSWEEAQEAYRTNPEAFHRREQSLSCEMVQKLDAAGYVCFTPIKWHRNMRGGYWQVQTADFYVR